MEGPLFYEQRELMTRTLELKFRENQLKLIRQEIQKAFESGDYHPIMETIKELAEMEP